MADTPITDIDSIGGLADAAFDEFLIDAKTRGEGLLSDLRDENLAQARTALTRYAQNNLAALRDPLHRETHLTSAAHNLNTLENLAALSKIEVRATARSFVEAVMARIWDITDKVIVAALVA